MKSWKEIRLLRSVCVCASSGGVVPYSRSSDAMPARVEGHSKKKFVKDTSGIYSTVYVFSFLTTVLLTVQPRSTSSSKMAASTQKRNWERHDARGAAVAGHYVMTAFSP